MKETLHLGEIRDVIEFLATRRDLTPTDPLDLAAADTATTGFSRIGINRSCMDHPLRVAGRTYERGLGVHAPSRLVFAVPAGTTAFVARVGVDDESPAGLAGFEVMLDGRSAWSSGPLKCGMLARAYVEIPKGTARMVLRVNDGGNGNDGDHADWCEAGFVK